MVRRSQGRKWSAEVTEHSDALDLEPAFPSSAAEGIARVPEALRRA